MDKYLSIRSKITDEEIDAVGQVFGYVENETQTIDSFVSEKLTKAVITQICNAVQESERRVNDILLDTLKKSRMAAFNGLFTATIQSETE